MKKWMKTAAAAVLGAAVCAAAGSLSASADAVLDGDTLILSGNVTKDEVTGYHEDARVIHIVAAERAVLPEDCSYMFYASDLMNTDFDSMGYWFKLESIDLSKADSSRVINTESMFSGTTADFLDLTGFDTSHVTNMHEMFYQMIGDLKELDLSSFDTSNVTDMGYMFFNSSSLKKIYVSELWDTDSVTDSEEMFGRCAKLTGGNGTAYNAEHTDKEYARIDKDGAPGYLTFGGSTVKGASLSLDGRIGLNFYVRLSSDAAKAVLEGPLGTVEIPRSEFAGLTVQEGDYAGCTKLTYGINATQRLNKVTLKLYDSENNLTDLYKGNAEPLTDKQFLYSAADYIDSYQDTGNENLTNLVTALERYFKSAENHFMGKTHTIFPEGYTHRWFDIYNSTDGDYALSLILNSGTDLRIYTDAAEVKLQTGFDEYETLTAETTPDGKRYFAITDIPAQNLVGSERIYVDGREHFVCPRDWCVLAVADDKPQTVQDLGWALYEYGKAAETYLHSL